MKQIRSLWLAMGTICLALLSATSSAMEPLQREIQDCPNCPTMIVVQGGTFWMGKTTWKALPTLVIRSLWVILPSVSLR